MALKNPPNAEDVRRVIEERVAAAENAKGDHETATVEWRGKSHHIPVISMPVDLLHYNPDTHRVRAQRSADASRERDLDREPWGKSAQSYLHDLLKGDPADPSKVDPSFLALQEDLRDHGQTDPGIVTRAGVLINGNTRRAALKDLGAKNIRVGVLPPDASFDDLRTVELSLQLRKDHRRDYSFMNFLLALDERTSASQPAAVIQSEFRINSTTYERSRWILTFVREAIERSKVDLDSSGKASLQLVHFEAHQGKLEELYRSYKNLKATSSDQAEALREQRLLAIVLGKSKTDLRLIEHDFTKQYMKIALPKGLRENAAPKRIPGTSINVAGPSAELQALRQLTSDALQARAIAVSSKSATTSEFMKASAFLGELDDSLDKGLDLAGKQARVVKKRFAPADRVSDACDNLELAAGAVAEARSSGNFDPKDLDEVLLALRGNLLKLAEIVARGSAGGGEGVAWLNAIDKMKN